MTNNTRPFQVVDLSRERRAWLNSLDLTAIFDPDVVDGAPAARFVHRLVELVESGYGLSETADR
jgi:pyruvate/2-oxoglutarate dehydrogenase complex dihydrolipoamide acyltransferase (E2) component